MSQAATARSRRLADHTWTSLDRPGLLVPVGSVEQHGPHLPVDTDAVIARAVASDAVRRLDEVDCLVAPPLMYGASGEHAGFPGTVSIGLEALRFVIVELVRSVAAWAAWVVFVNGHGGNAIALRKAVGQLCDEGHAVGWVPCAVPDADAHAGHTESSLMLHLAPDRLDLAAAAPGDPRPVTEVMDLLRTGGMRAVSPSGVLGDPTGATADEGARMLERMAADVAWRIRAFVPDEHGILIRP